ncbi:hypothetical protein CPC08DRAFT_765299 [Agrocybe pediades]|nr:hypothetical protein CPC08DRAFT_765299 [Agrocybe pediades]
MALSSPPSSPPLSDTPSSPGISVSNKQVSALDKVQALLQQLLRITAIDGRIFVGTFAGTDKPLNIILINAEEYRMGPEHDADGRYVGQVMLPWKKHIHVNIAHTVTPSFVGPALT